MQVLFVGAIFGQDERAKLKRLKGRNGKIRLIPESYDPSKYEPDWKKEFNELDDEFRIVGVVEAVFKKRCNARAFYRGQKGVLKIPEVTRTQLV